MNNKPMSFLRLVSLVFFALPAVVVASPSDSFSKPTDTIQVRHHGSHPVLNEDELLQFVPIELAEYHPNGRTDTLHRFVAQVWPLSDSGGIEIDTTSTTPDYLFVLYNTMDSKLVLLKREQAVYAIHWSSNKMIGEMGSIRIKDLNHDGEMEIIVDLQIVPRLRPNIFLYTWNNGNLQSLYPSGYTAGFSAFSVNVNFIESDTGLTIKTIRSGNESTYFYGKNSSEIRLISETPVDSKD